MEATRKTPLHKVWNKGVAIAAAVILCWLACLTIGLKLEVNWTSPFTYLLILLQAHLYTGLFITAHDAMHGVVHSNRKINATIGLVTAFLYVFNNYSRLNKNHDKHHDEVGTATDPDVHRNSFFIWFLKFLRSYISIWQILLAAAFFNLLALFFPEKNVVLFWMIPSFLSMLQLFIFGTYLPHRAEFAGKNAYCSGTQRAQHLWAFLSCYFFGYHLEHHRWPATPWWRLPQRKAQLDS